MLTPEQKRTFVKDGFVKIAAAIPSTMVQEALRAINHSIGTVGKTGADPARYRVDTFCAELRHAPVLTDVFDRPPLLPLVESLLGEGNVLPVDEVQIAPRFPLPVGTEAPPLGGHLDAAGTGTNGAALGTYRRDFTVIAIVYLVDVPGPYCGNFTAWPGSHRETRDYFRRVPHDILSRDMNPPIPVSGTPRMVTGAAGDVILAHHLIRHEGGPNLSPHVRHAIISRISHRQAALFGKQAYTDMWHEWEGITAYTAALA